MLACCLSIIGCKNKTNDSGKKQKAETVLEVLKDVKSTPEAGEWFIDHYQSKKYYPALKIEQGTYLMEFNRSPAKRFHVEIYDSEGLPILSKDDETISLEITSKNKKTLKVKAGYYNQASLGFYRAIFELKESYEILQYLLEANSEVNFKFTGVNRREPHQPMEKTVSIPIDGFKETLKCWIEDITSDGSEYYGLNIKFPTE